MPTPVPVPAGGGPTAAAGRARPVARAAVAAAAALVAAVPAAPAPAYAAGCPQPLQRAAALTDLPWPQQLYDTARLAGVADGRGVRVAVVDSGVDATHPQLRGRVAAGRDLLRRGPSGRQDCVGHGTGVASIVAAAAVRGVRFHGLAPGATVVPVRVSEQRAGPGPDDPQAPAALAAAIRWAAGHADVINLSLVTARDDPRVRAAVAAAVAADVVVVAAVGNGGGPTGANPVPYPAAYPGVIGVAALGRAGVRAGTSQHGPYVDVAAPGEDVVRAWPGGGHVRDSGTSFAAPFVSATAALVRQRWPGLSAAEVARRILATTDPAPGGGRSDGYGRGVLNPYRALTEALPGPAPASTPAAARPAVPAAAPQRGPAGRVYALAGAGAAAGLLVAVAAAVLRRGRRRGWRPAGP